MTKLKADLKAKLDKISHIYLLAQDAYLYTEYFHNPETEDEKSLVLNTSHSADIRFIMHLMFRSLIIEVCKLYTNNSKEKFRLSAFVDSLSSAGHFRKINISPELTQRWKESLLSNQAVISNVLTLRNKVYAHSDNPLKSYSDIELTFKNIKALLDLAADILREVYSIVFEEDNLLNSKFDRTRFDVLKLLAKAENQRIEEVYKEYFPGRL